jgi:methylmalonyl-CoA/ethylmalonyl-CoA epimerase
MTDARLHHVGIVVAAIEPVAEHSAHHLHACWDGTVHVDPHQRVRVSFLAGAGFANFELVEPLDDSSPVAAFLRRGGGLHHMCFEVDSLDTQMERCRSEGAVLVKPPLPAVAFQGRRIFWTLSRERLLVEWLERAASPAEASVEVRTDPRVQ